MSDGLSYILPIVFIVSLIAALAIYKVGGMLAPKTKPTIEQTTTYSCGEIAPAKEAKLDLERFLTFAVYFLIFDVLAFVTMTSFYATDFMPAVYSLIVLVAVGMLLFAKKRF